jgi:chorismate-pyruvate lyase
MSRSDPRGVEDGVVAVARATELARIFCPDAAAFGRIVAANPREVPDVSLQLLDHRGHMTVTMERFHRCELVLHVLGETTAALDEAYAREILLSRPDGVVVQYGIVRIDLRAIAPGVAAEIRAGRTPLGRILLAAGLLCVVHHVALLRIEPGPHLRATLASPAATTAFGRVAEILVADRPAIELLEIVAPAAHAAGRG